MQRNAIKWNRFTWFMLLLMSITPATGQQNDDLILVEDDAPTKEDPSEYLELLFDIIEETSRVQVDTALRYAKEALDLSQQLNEERTIARSNFMMGLVYKNMGMGDSALYFLRIAHEFYETENIKVVPSAEVAFQIGTVLQNQGRNEESLPYLQEALDIFESIDQQYSVAVTLVGIGIVHTNIKNYPLALNYYERAKEIYSELDHKRGIADCLVNIGNIYQQDGRFDQAYVNYREALTIDKELDYQFGIIYDLQGIGDIQFERKRFDDALDNYQEALDLLDGSGWQKEKAAMLTSVAKVHVRQNDPQRALSYLKQALPIAEQTGALDNLQDVYLQLAKAHEQLGEYQQAYQYHQLYTTVSDSIVNEQSAKALAEMEARYESQKKETEIEQLRMENDLAASRNRYLLLLFGGSVLALLFIGVLVWMRMLQRMNRISTKFVPHEFLHAIGRNSILSVRLGDQVHKEVTVLFADIRDYTSICENMTPEESFDFISTFVGKMGPIIQSNKGFVHQYLGDGIMAIFPAESDHAMKAAVEMQRYVKSYNETLKSEKKPPIRVGIGIHSGPLVMGIIGDDHRIEPASISDTVNTASRMEGLTKVYGAPVLVSESSIGNVVNRSHFQFRHLGKVQVKGKQNAVGVYELYDHNKKLIN